MTMNQLIDPGELNVRLKFFKWESEQDGLDLNEVYTEIFRIWGKVEPVKPLTFWFGQQNLETGVTHRITVRRIQGKTAPEDLTGRIVIYAQGCRFKVLHASDWKGSRRFTLIECAEEEIDDESGT